MSKLTELEQVIGYEFNEQRLLQQALTHSSFANEKHMKKLSDNERLEFLGDAVLEVVSSEFLYKEHTDLPEGDLTKLRASIVCEPHAVPGGGTCACGAAARAYKTEERHLCVAH